MSTEPVVSGARIAPPEAELRLVIPADLDYFVGHFPGAPIVPGVVQIKWALELARRHVGALGQFAGMEAVKFQRVMVPELVVTLTLRFAAADGKLRFSYEAEGARFSSGRLLLRARA